MRDFRNLKVWEKAHVLVVAIYQATVRFPKEETYGLTSQIRRSAASIPANIAEGCGRSTGNELARFMDISMGSANELDYHLLLAKDLGFLKTDVYQHLYEQVNEVKKMLNAFTQKLRSED